MYITFFFRNIFTEISKLAETFHFEGKIEMASEPNFITLIWTVDESSKDVWVNQKLSGGREIREGRCGGIEWLMSGVGVGSSAEEVDV